MKPEELDELFRRGLAEQQLTPRPQAWDSVQQRLRAPIGEEDELPAFLRQSSPAAAAPSMMASRGGAGGMTISWHQRPVWRAAAVAVLAVGTLLAQQQLSQQHTAQLAPATVAMAPAAHVVPQPAPAPVATRSAAVAAAPTPAPKDVETASTTAQPATEPKIAFPKEALGYELASTDISSALIHEHLLCESPKCQECDRIEQKIGPARFRSLRAEAASELLARNGVRPGQSAATGFALASATPTRSVRRHTPAPPALHSLPAPGMPADAPPADFDPTADNVVEITIHPGSAPMPATELAEANEVAPEASEAPQVVARSAGRQSLRPGDVLRRASERMRDMLDRADHSTDGRLTIDTRVVGRPVRKTISL